jgi:hypothetical protein
MYDLYGFVLLWYLELDGASMVMLLLMLISYCTYKITVQLYSLKK